MRPLYFIGIDGSTSTLGVSYLCCEKGGLTVLETKLIDVSRVDERWESYLEKYGGLSCRIARIEEGLSEFLMERQVDMVFYEQHFINPRRPTSVIPLARSQQMVERLCMTLGVGVEYIPPQLMKKMLDIKVKKATKDDVKAGIASLIQQKKLTYTTDALEGLSEHEVDAIGIVYAKCRVDALLT